MGGGGGLSGGPRGCQFCDLQPCVYYIISSRLKDVTVNRIRPWKVVLIFVSHYVVEHACWAATIRRCLRKHSSVINMSVLNCLKLRPFKYSGYSRMWVAPYTTIYDGRRLPFPHWWLVTGAARSHISAGWHPGFDFLLGYVYFKLHKRIILLPSTEFRQEWTCKNVNVTAFRRENIRSHRMCATCALTTHKFLHLRVLWSRNCFDYFHF